MSSRISRWQAQRRHRLQPSYYQQKRRGRGRLLGVLVALVVLIWGASNYYQSGLRLARDSKDNTRISFEVAAGEGFGQIVSRLRQADLLYSPLAVKAYGWLHSGVAIKPGKYVLRRDLKALEIISILTGQSVLEQWLTIPEGWRLTQIAERIEAQNLGSKELFLLQAKDASLLPPELKQRFPFLQQIPPGQGLEGYLFPDSYIIPPQAKPTEIIARALSNLAKKLEPDISQTLKDKGLSLHNLLTMASIVEWEATKEEDRRLIADVLWRRLANGIALGVDPTVLYALGSWDAPLTKENLQINSPYNTRRYAGMPPGPIAAPSLTSVLAAAKPKTNDYWYFLADNEGVIHYARTLEEHNQQKSRYLR